MNRPRLRTVLLLPLLVFAGIYLLAAARLLQDDRTVAAPQSAQSSYAKIAIFGATGTAGDGLLKAAMADPSVETIYVITRRLSPRIEAGAAAGKVQVTLHQDYLDYSAVIQQLAAVDAVFWAIGVSSRGVDETTYGKIHVDFPLRFVTEWLTISQNSAPTFHYISSSDISADSSMMWAREKVRAENTLFDFAADTRLKVIAYRPDYIGPTREEAHPGQWLLYGFFRPVGAAVRATEIGEAMLEVTARKRDFENGAKLSTGKIVRHSRAYQARLATR